MMFCVVLKVVMVVKRVILRLFFLSLRLIIGVLFIDGCGSLDREFMFGYEWMCCIIRFNLGLSLFVILNFKWCKK